MSLKPRKSIFCNCKTFWACHKIQYKTNFESFLVYTESGQNYSVSWSAASLGGRLAFLALTSSARFSLSASLSKVAASSDFLLFLLSSSFFSMSRAVKVGDSPDPMDGFSAVLASSSTTYKHVHQWRDPVLCWFVLYGLCSVLSGLRSVVRAL